MVDSESSGSLMGEIKTHISVTSTEWDRPTDGIKVSAKERATFAPILATIDLATISKFASTVRQSGHQSTANRLTGTMASHSFISCKVDPTPFSGSYNIVFALEFSDGISWMLKIPANGHGQQFDKLASKSLVAEARTMQMIKKATTIPVPTVYAFDASLGNELHAPFILMERIDGAPLYQGWYNEDGHPKAQLEKFRARVLQNLASAMVQLNHFMLDRGGSIVFDSDGKAVSVGGTKVSDANAIWYREDDYPDDNDIFCEKGPFTDPKSDLLFMLDRRPSQPNDNAYLKGIYVLLRMFIEWAYERDTSGSRFVLSHPDFDIQNILVAQDGTLRGLIDWDGVAAVPREVGAAQYPMWLMHDWIESQYDYDIGARKSREEAEYDESSPNELSCYRAMYAQFVEQEITLSTEGPKHLTVHGTTPKEEADITRRSLVMRNLEIATNSPMVTSDIVDHMLALIVDLTEADWEDREPRCASPSSTDIGNETEEMECDVEDATVENILKGSSSSESNICSNSDDSSMDTKATEIGNEVPFLIAGDLAQLFDSEVVNTNTSVSEPSIAPKVGMQEQDQKPSADFDRKELKSSTLGWTRRLLRLGCNTAEKVLRRAAKIGYVPNNGVDEARQGLAKVDMIPARNNELLEIAKAEKSAAGPARNKAETKEQKVWERVALEVRNCRVPVDILEKHEDKITSYIIDTVIDELKAQQKQDQDLATKSDMLLAAETISAAARMAKTSAAGAGPVNLTSKSVHRGHITLNDKNLIMSLTNATELRPSTRSLSESWTEALLKEAISGLQGLCRSCTSYLKRISPRPMVMGVGSWYVTPDSSVHSGGQQEDEEDTLSFQVTSLDLNRDEGDGHRAEDVEDEGNRAEDQENRTKEATEENKDHRHPTFTEGSSGEIGPVEPSVHSNVYDLRRGEWVGAVKVAGYHTSDTVPAVVEEVRDVQLAVEDVVGHVKDSEAIDEAGGGEVEYESEDDVFSGDEDEDPPQQRVEFVDRGRFDTWTILNVLGNGDLDELRMLRLKEGFFKLLEQC